jgi:hypothetical protein
MGLENRALVSSWQERVHLCVYGGRAGGFAVEGYVGRRATERGANPSQSVRAVIMG